MATVEIDINIGESKNYHIKVEDEQIVLDYDRHVVIPTFHWHDFVTIIGQAIELHREIKGYE
jgi:hypothetical protein